MRTSWTLVTVAYNSAADLTLYGTRPPDDVDWVVVDNASTDDSAAVAEALGARVIRLPKNLGFGQANNVGILAARSDFVGCVNPDVRVNYADLDGVADTLDLLDFFDADRNGHLLAPQLVNADGTAQPNGRGVPTFARKVRNRVGGTDVTPYRVYANPGERRYVAWATGAAILARRSVWERLHMWDDRFFVYYEDQDLGLRGWADNIPTVVDGNFRWTHGWARETAGKFRLRPWLLELDGMSRFYSRYPGLLVSEAFLPSRFVTARALSGMKVRNMDPAVVRSRLRTRAAVNDQAA